MIPQPSSRKPPHCSPEGFKGTYAADAGAECLKLKVGAEKNAAFFETRRWVTMLYEATNRCLAIRSCDESEPTHHH
jgi:hypothetical protein